MSNRSLITVLEVAASLAVLPATLDLRAEAPPDTAFRVSPIAAASQDRRTVVRGTTEFALDVYGRLRATPGNLVFSPISLSTALAMTAEGAAGRTRAEIVSALHVPMSRADRPRAFQSVLADLLPQDGGGVRIEVANALWSDRDFVLRPAFVRRLQRSFGARASEVDLDDRSGTARTINDWAREATHGLVPHVLSADDLPERTALVLANSVYFLGEWQEPFDDREEALFFTPDGPVTVPLMNNEGDYAAVFLDDVRVAELPYRGGEYSMLVFLPVEFSLARFESGLTPASLATIVAALEPTLLDLKFPAFSYESRFDLAGPLMDLGIETAFSERADFSRAAARGLSIGFVRQNASIRVDEEGTVAAAVTTIGFGGAPQVIGDTPRAFRIDRPFLFAIRHRQTGTLLFLGRVEDPTKHE